MNSPLPPRGTGSPSNRVRRTRRLLLALAVLLAEYLALSFLLDVQSVAERGGPWQWISKVGAVGPWLIVGVVGFFLVPGAHSQTDEEVAPPRLGTLWLGGHALSAGALGGLSFHLFRAEAPGGSALLWIALWLAFAASSFCTLLLALVGQIVPLVKQASPRILLGLLLGTFVWSAASLSTTLWEPLSRATFLVVATLLHWLGFELLADYQQVLLELDGFAIVIAPVCSGFEGIGLYVALLGAYLYRLRSSFRFPQALLLFPAGVLLVWLGNAARIAALMVVGAKIDPELAIGSFHSKAGWVFFSAITLAIAELARRIPYFHREEETSTPEVTPAALAAPYLVPLLVWIAGGLLSSVFFDGHDPYYGLRVLGTGFVLFAFREHYRSFLRRPTPLAYVCGIAVGALWLLAPYYLAALPGVFPLPEPRALPTTPGWLVFRAAGAVLLIPLVEELAFRAFIARRFSGENFQGVSLRDVSLVGVFGSSILFGAVHGQWVLGTLTGVFYCLLVRRSGRLSDGIVAHALSNLTLVVYAISTGEFGHL